MLDSDLELPAYTIQKVTGHHRDVNSVNELPRTHPKLIEFLESNIGPEFTCRMLCQDDLCFDTHKFLPQNAAGFVCLNRLNNVRRINKFLEKYNQSLKAGQFIVVKMETKYRRAIRIRNQFPVLLFYPVTVIDFFIHRALPKLYLTKGIYFGLTKGKNRVITLPEGLARLIACGFDILDYRLIGNETYILAKKIKKPAFDLTPTYGLFIKLKRIGQHGNVIDVYKIRTMHPFSEYLQEYLYKKHGTNNGDKIEDDFRVTSWGKFIRKFWIDELPMVWNLLRRDLKLVGVRPISEHKFSTYPVSLQMKRTQFKPGLIPPFYVDLPKTTEEFYQSEEKYLNSYEKNPVRTDLKYLFIALYNILIKGERSR